MNESIKNMIERRSVRGYKPDMIPKEDLDLILEAGTYAATGMGMQSPVIVAVTDKATRDQLSKMNADVMGTDTDPFYGAPVVLVVLADKNRPTYIYDGSLGSTVRKKSSHRKREKYFLRNGAWKVTMKVSGIVCSDILLRIFLKRSLAKRIMCIM